MLKFIFQIIAACATVRAVELQPKNRRRDGKPAAPPPAKKVECPICLETVTGTVIQTVCGHKFCKPCIDTSLETRDNCPICRRRAPLVAQRPAAAQNRAAPRPAGAQNGTDQRPAAQQQLHRDLLTIDIFRVASFFLILACHYFMYEDSFSFDRMMRKAPLLLLLLIKRFRPQ